MTLYETIRAIEAAAASQPAVQMIVRNDIFRLNACPSAKYGVFGWLQQQHSSSVESSLVTYQFTFFYVDRLTEDKGNELFIQSTGIRVLDNIIKSLELADIYAEGRYSFQVFNQRFADECAGVWCSVSFSVPADSTCEADIDGYESNIVIY